MRRANNIYIIALQRSRCCCVLIATFFSQARHRPYRQLRKARRSSRKASLIIGCYPVGDEIELPVNSQFRWLAKSRVYQNLERKVEDGRVN